LFKILELVLKLLTASTWSVPVRIDVVPVNPLLFPDRMSVPEPSIVKAPDPLIIPATVAVPTWVKTRVPLSVTFVAEGQLLAVPICRVPALMVTGPPNVFNPERISVPVPSFVRELEPVMLLSKETRLALLLMIPGPFRVIGRVIVMGAKISNVPLLKSKGPVDAPSSLLFVTTTVPPPEIPVPPE